MYDLVVIGSGPGGYVAAIRAAQLGLKTAIIEKYATLGGTCLNVGCIPSKALLDSSEHFYNAKHTFTEHGIDLQNLSVNWTQMLSRKNQVVKQTCEGVAFLMKKNKIEVLQGTASFKDKNTILIQQADATKEITTKNTIIATGSKPTSIPTIPIDKKRIITSTEALNLTELPKHLIVIGGGVIGLEMSSVFARLGCKVSVVEYADKIIGMFDVDMYKELQKSLKKIGIEFYLSHQVQKAENKGDTVTIEATNLKNNTTLVLEGDYCLVSIGRKAYTTGLGLENIGIQLDEKGRIPVNEGLETAIPSIYAIGDVVRGTMLAHKAEEEGVYVAEKIAGQKPHLNYHLIPNVVYTWPEVASVGYTEEEVKTKAIAYKTGIFPFKASGRARASMDTDGLIKVIADKNTDEILGVHMIGPRVADMIAEAVVAMEYRASAEDIARICHAHPTFTESFKEACLAATDNRALHI